MNEVIKLAIEKGGYKFPDLEKNIVVLSNARAFGKATAHKMQLAYVAQDPLFWQALGKALGWLGTTESYRCPEHPDLDITRPQKYCIDCGKELQGVEYDYKVWLKHALTYHELNLTSGDTEKFWKDLLK